MSADVELENYEKFVEDQLQMSAEIIKSEEISGEDFSSLDISALMCSFIFVSNLIKDIFIFQFKRVQGIKIYILFFPKLEFPC